ncbi:MAG: OsmC family protein, partial [Nitrospirota bacterium]
MKLTITYRGGTRFDVSNGTHTLVTAQPTEDGGSDAGMTPVELFVGSLAGCVGYFVGRYCARHKIPSERLTIDAEWSMAEQPHRVGTIALRVCLPAEATLTPEQRERLLKVA